MSGVDALPTIEDALELYLSIKGVGRQKLFFTTAQRYIGYMIECLGVRPIDQYSSRDATLLREWLFKERIKSSVLCKEYFSSIKAVINFSILEQGLNCQNAFSKVYLPTHTDVKKRHSISTENMISIKQACLTLDDDIRLVNSFDL